LVLTLSAFSADFKHEEMRSYSQASQDRFVHVLLYEILGKQDEGYYLEIGAGHPSQGSNTYALEKDFGWKGVSIDISDGYKTLWDSTRQNYLLIEDAIHADYRAILKPFPQVIDYLSLDIDRDYDVVLNRIPFDEHIFKIITIEHDAYRFGDKYREDERKILASLGYYLLCPDVSLFFNGRDSIFEDWWIHPSTVSSEVLPMLMSLDLKGKNHEELIKILRKY